MGIRIKKDFPSFDVFIVIFDDEKKAMMDPNEEVNAPVPFKKHQIDWIVFLTCSYRPNPNIILELVEKMRKKLGSLNDCPTSYNETEV
ncbi:hypothetical protein CRE_16298 [Caenorhabditis remanei]|uniref:Uncharacterized protein n=1 Tax=Caenorhabditis remanei TaxID=31234 RepID=E3N7Z3_CAERE|nr:hypothetical protein CRE_16298 [Caenorhabditis remanei]